MKKITALLPLLLCLCLLTACGCKHEWKESTCETPKTCTLCNETEGESLGHNWQDASCEVPRTCSVCGLTEGDAPGHSWVDATCESPKTCSVCSTTDGEALGHNWTDATCQSPKVCTVCTQTEGSAADHSFSIWEMGEETMTRSCTVCATEESAPADWNVFLRDLLADRWICTEVESLNGPLDMYVYFPQTPFLEITEDQRIRFFNGTENNFGTAEYVHRMEKDGIRSDVFKVLEDGNPRLLFSYRVPVDAAESSEQIFASPGLGTFKLEREPEEDKRIRQAMVGSWTSGTAGYQTVTFRDDYSVTVQINGEQIDAAWSCSSLNASENEINYSCYVRYLKDMRWEQFLASLTVPLNGESPELRIMFDGDSVYYTAE